MEEHGIERRYAPRDVRYAGVDRSALATAKGGAHISFLQVLNTPFSSLSVTEKGLFRLAEAVSLPTVTTALSTSYKVRGSLLITRKVSSLSFAFLRH